MQGELFLYPDQRKHMDRLFFGLLPDPDTAMSIETVARRFQWDHDIAATLQALHRLHISIQHVGDYPRLREKQVYAAQLVGASLQLPIIAVSLQTIGSFQGPPIARGKPPHHPLAMEAQGDGLVALFDALGDAMRQNHLRPNKRFTPHLTLSYGPALIPFQAIAPIRFVAREVVLIHSEVGMTRYHLLGRWPLRDVSPCAPSASGSVSAPWDRSRPAA
jgi:2'-5' RNA ligase